MTKPYSLDLRDRAVCAGGGGRDGPLGCGDVAGGRFEPREMVAALSRDGQRGAEKDGRLSAARSDWRTPGVASAADRQRVGYDLARAGRRTGRAGRQGELSNGLELRSSREDQL